MSHLANLVNSTNAAAFLCVLALLVYPAGKYLLGLRSILHLIVEGGRLSTWNFRTNGPGPILEPGTYDVVVEPSPTNRLPVVALCDRKTPGDVVGLPLLMVRRRIVDNPRLTLTR